MEKKVNVQGRPLTSHLLLLPMVSRQKRRTAPARGFKCSAELSKVKRHEPISSRLKTSTYKRKDLKGHKAKRLLTEANEANEGL
ncbi:MAG: hypothetical protein WAM44_11125 [Chthoniobacterales bacterium]